MKDSCSLSFSIIFTALFILEKTKIITHSISNDFRTPNIAPIILFKSPSAISFKNLVKKDATILNIIIVIKKIMTAEINDK